MQMTLRSVTIEKADHVSVLVKVCDVILSHVSPIGLWDLVVDVYGISSLSAGG